MSLDVEKLLAAISVESPCGENLEYDPDYAAMELAATGRPEQQFGPTVIPGEEPDWREVRGKAVELLSRSKDLRVATNLVRAAVATDGPVGLADGLAVLAGLVENYWEGVHPQLDPEDGNDPTLRLNTLSSLGDAASTVKSVREAKLVRSPALGQFSFRDVLAARGEASPAADGTAVEQSTIDAAFADCDGGELKATAAAVNRALEYTKSIEENVTARAGIPPSLAPLADLLSAMSLLLERKLKERGLRDEEAAPETASDESASADETDGAEASASAASNGRKRGAPASGTGDISSRDDVIRAIDRICDYYKRYEPSSPVPLFLNRAKRLASKSFLEILRDLTPDALNQALALGGLTDANTSSEATAAVDANDL